ncbi:YjbH domain-containing protein [Roseovarius sp. 2305UL8-3]|uniref:YjbH domain-containing protein n=1 Tax=Roseovarius conchicola TaxID=3121636 RepID=UPI003529AED4
MIDKTTKIATIALALTWPVAATPENLVTKQTSTYGTPGGLIDLPTAEMAPDGQLSTTIAYYEGASKTTLTFQLLPRLTGSFRYSGTDDLTPQFSTFYDRSFDLRFRLFNETTYTPAVAIGLQDFIGTGVLGGEYIVATKSIGDRLRVTGGVGWGRFGSYNSFGSTGTRPGFDPMSTGGDFSTDDWFRGDYSFFGGASYDLTERLSFAAEYSSDAYDQEVAAGIFERKTPWNFGLTYKAREDVFISAYALHGSEFGARVNLTLNPKIAAAPGGTELAPVPVAVRPAASARDLGWTMDSQNTVEITNAVNRRLDKEGLDLDGVQLSGTTAHIRIRNTTYDARSQALGRSLRVLSRTLPDSIETMRVTLVSQGMPASTITFNRSDLEQLENAPASEALAAATFSDPLSFSDYPDPLPGLYPIFNWSLGPYLRTSFFDPDNPVRADIGVRAKADVDFGRGWIASGSVSAKVAGNLDNITRTSNSIIPHVRSNVAQFLKEEDPVIDRLTLAKYFRPAENIYGRVTVGYLESMYAGASGELLWKPVDSRLAIGIEANYVEPRDFDQLFGLRSRTTPGGVIPRASGHISAYYDLGNGFHTQLDVGRYLAGDWGATIALDREFANGWKVGAFMTKTDVSSTQFGEGSFDKGIRLTVPLSWALGKPTQKSASMTLRPLTRDGGARLEVEGRLYETIRSSHQPEIAKSWGKFWR